MTTTNEYISRASKTSNVANALANFDMWLGWHPKDYKGATEFAGDTLETVAEVDEFEQCVQGYLILDAVKAVDAASSL